MLGVIICAFGALICLLGIAVALAGGQTWFVYSILGVLCTVVGLLATSRR